MDEESSLCFGFWIHVKCYNNKKIQYNHEDHFERLTQLSYNLSCVYHQTNIVTILNNELDEKYQNIIISEAFGMLKFV